MSIDYLTLLHKPVDGIIEADVRLLLDNQIAERKVIEYKSALPGPKDAEKKEFLADVSSFANASGGVLLYGVPAQKGIPHPPIGLQIPDPDALVLQLESVIRTGISPRIPNVTVKPVPLQGGGFVVVIQVPRSWASPHRVTFQGWDKFFSRTSAGKYPLDVHELRAAFVLSESTAERVRAFRLERLSKIVADEAPVPLTEGPKMILHLVPFTAFDPSTRSDLLVLTKDMALLQPIGFGFDHHRFNLDGLLTYDVRRGATGADGYLQVFRNGCIEAVDAYWVRATPDKPLIPSVAYEQKILQVLPKYLEIERRLGMQPPVVIMLTLHAVKGYALAVSTARSPFGGVSHTIDRDTLVIPEVLLEDLNLDPVAIMRPIFDAVWNAAGLPRSMNYDADGKWVGQS